MKVFYETRHFREQIMKFWFWDLESFGLNYLPIFYKKILRKLRNYVNAILPITSLFSVTFSLNLEGEYIFQTQMTTNVTKFTKGHQISPNVAKIHKILT